MDPVRFIGNFSTGKMGYAIASQLAERGANVTLVSGPTHLNIAHPNVNRINVTTAEEMYKACHNVFHSCDAAILSAAVADYKPLNTKGQKIKKGTENMTLELVKNKDILASLGKTKTAKQVLIGFSLETHNEKEFALGKLHNKNLDFIVLNSLNDPGAGFGHDTNKISILKASGQHIDFSLKSKELVAVDVVNELITTFTEKLAINEI